MINFRVPHKAENFVIWLSRWVTLHDVRYVSCLAWQNRWMNQRKGDMNRPSLPAIYNKSSFAIITRTVQNNLNSYITNQTQMSTFSDSPQFLTQMISHTRAAYPSHHSSNITWRSARCKDVIHFRHADLTAFRPHIFRLSSLSKFCRCCPLKFRRLSTLYSLDLPYDRSIASSKVSSQSAIQWFRFQFAVFSNFLKIIQ